ncbi:ATP-binding cassette domain-containing protein [Streptomyces sp. NPDC058045]|uniref:ABC transporter ATP-binding protein n=1 Tax=Streptomyces sp. NPDC058045 TaxID=3346311 RepID=UPI0036E32D4A
MIQAIGLTSTPGKQCPAAVDDVSMEAHEGQVTALLGRAGAGKTTALRLMLELAPGRGITLFRGRPLHRIAHPAREVGVLLGDVPGHPARTVRGQLHMLCAAAGVPGSRADDVLEAVGLVSLRGERLGTLSRGVDRRLGLACALLTDPHALVLDEPADSLSTKEAHWLHGVLRSHASQGGTVLFATKDAKEAARTADRVVTLEAGRIIADQEAGDFARTRLRPRVAVRTPHAARLGLLLAKEARASRRSVEVVKEDGNRLSVYGSVCAEVGETAFRHGILVHQLAEETGDMGEQAYPLEVQREQQIAELARAATTPALPTVPDPASDTPADPVPHSVPDPGPGTGGPTEEPPVERTAKAGTLLGGSRGSAALPGAVPAARAAPEPLRQAAQLPPPIRVRAARVPLRPLRYELHRVLGVGTGYGVAAVMVAASVLISLFLARAGHTAAPRLFTAWPAELPLPPAALAAGLLGALAFGEEFRHPALAADRGNVPRRLGLLAAKLLVSAATACLFAFLAVGCDAAILYLVYGSEVVSVPGDWPSLWVSWDCLTIGCAWAGLLAAGVFRSTAAGLAAVLGVPVVGVPLAQQVLSGPSVRTAAGLPGRLRDLALVQWPFGAERYIAAGLRMIVQPVGTALSLALAVLLCAYLLTGVRRRVRG